MASWHQRARLGVAIFGVAVAAGVYMTMRERPVAAPQAAVARHDPKAVFEMDASMLERFTGVERNFEVGAERFFGYDDGSTKLTKPRITVPKEEGRTFTITAAEGVAAKDQNHIELDGAVRIDDSDGFFLTTDRASFEGPKSLARAAGAVMFGRGRMSGSGTDVSYGTTTDVLIVRQQAEVVTTAEDGATAMRFAAGGATLDRMQHLLTLESTVHVVRGEETIDADRAVARLSAGDDVIQFIELRGNARVTGGGSGIDAMSARDIDLDYSDDGQRLEAVTLVGGAAAALTGSGGSQQLVGETVRATFAPDGGRHLNLTGNAVITMIAENGREGRRIAGDQVEIDVAPDGTLTRAVGRENVRLDLPPVDGGPPRSIRARTLDGAGTAGQGLTAATFNGDVVFTERAPDGAERTARAARLETSFAKDAVSGATFTGDATFEEAGLKACAAQMQYLPGKGTLALTGSAGTNPLIAEEQVMIEAQTIDVTLDTRRMMAKGAVQTQMGTPARCAPARARAASERRTVRKPGLLQQDAAATITAATLDYQGEAGTALYSGRAVLSQGNTSVYGDTIRIDQANGDLTATGNAISRLPLDGDTSLGRAHEIRYVDKDRLVTLAAPPAGAVVAPAGRGRGPVIATEPELSAPLGHLRAGRIEIVLAEAEGRADRIGASTNVRMTQTESGRTVTGAATFTYEPQDEKYVFNGDGATPVKVIEREGTSCREFIGRSLTFYKSNETVLIDGQNRNRTQIAPGACPAPTR